MTDCKRCNGEGHLSRRIFVDDYTTCPECSGSGEDVQALIAYYEHLYKYPYMLRWILEADQRALESARDDRWWRLGLYDALGYDRHMVTYQQYIETEAELGEILEDEIVTEDEKYEVKRYGY